MSTFKRLGNLGRGLWKVKLGGGDPEEASRVEALRRELAAMEAARPRTEGASGGTGAGVKAADPQARLDALAESLRKGEIDRATYDARAEAILATLEGPAAAPPPAPGKRSL